MMRVSRWRVVFFLIALSTTLLSLKMVNYPPLSTLFWKSVNKVRLHQSVTGHLSTSAAKNTIAERSSCPDITNGMMNGKWKTRPLTTKERTEIEMFTESLWMLNRFPKSLQRNDNTCGGVTYPGRYYHRALCNPKGKTPCCYEGRCVNKSPDKCHCAKCYDLRTQIHAEYSLWKPADSRCQVKHYTAMEAIHLLQGAQLVVVGDSFMGHLYRALLLVLSNNSFHGVRRPKPPRGLPNLCSGLFTFICRGKLETQATFHNDSVRVSYLGVAWTNQAENFMSTVRQLLSKPRTYVLVSLGMAGSFRQTYYDEFLLPAIKMIESNNTIWPRMIWTTYHKFGILSSRHPRGSEAAKVYNQFMRTKLRQHDMPIFDIWNLTVGVMSPDGGHFGVGLNTMKAQMFLNFFEDLKRKGKL